jgi:hypothetical protein
MQKEKPVHSDPANGMPTAGEVAYLCDSTSGPRIAYVLAETQFFAMQNSGVWMVSWLYSFIAPQAQARDTLETILHALSTLEINPQWEYRQLMMNRNTGEGAMSDFRNSMAQIHLDYERRSAASQSQ